MMFLQSRDVKLHPKASIFLKIYHLNPFAAVDAVPISVARSAYEHFVISQNTLIPKLYHVETKQVTLEDDECTEVRIYRPTSQKAPILLYFHGGGWCLGSLNTHDVICKQLALAAQCTVVSVEYRRAPEHKFPCAVDDGFLAYRWCINNTTYLNAIKDNIAIAGDSAGANIATSVVIKCIEEGIKIPTFQLLLYPVVDLRLSQPSMHRMSRGYFLTKSEMEYYINNYIDTKDLSHFLASPLNYNKINQFPPTILLTAECDPLRDDGRKYFDELITAGVNVQYREAAGMIHGFMQMNMLFNKEISSNLLWISEQVKKFWSF